MKELKDYIHLYLGCDIMYDESKCKLFGVHEAYCVIEMKGLGMVKIGKPYEQIKLTLRPLSDMTEEERKEFHMVNLTGKNNKEQCEANNTKWLLDRFFDVYKLIEFGLAIDKKTLIHGN